MKTLRNKQTGKLERVKDKDALPKVKYGWEYVSKSEWKNQFRNPKVETNDNTTSKKQRKNSSK
jgi:hypothetical protein